MQANNGNQSQWHPPNQNPPKNSISSFIAQLDFKQIASFVALVVVVILLIAFPGVRNELNPILREKKLEEGAKPAEDSGLFVLQAAEAEKIRAEAVAEKIRAEAVAEKIRAEAVVNLKEINERIIRMEIEKEKLGLYEKEIKLEYRKELEIERTRAEERLARAEQELKNRSFVKPEPTQPLQRPSRKTNSLDNGDGKTPSKNSSSATPQDGPVSQLSGAPQPPEISDPPKPYYKIEQRQEIDPQPRSSRETDNIGTTTSIKRYGEIFNINQAVVGETIISFSTNELINFVNANKSVINTINFAGRILGYDNTQYPALIEYPNVNNGWKFKYRVVPKDISKPVTFTIQTFTL